MQLVRNYSTKSHRTEKQPKLIRRDAVSVTLFTYAHAKLFAMPPKPNSLGQGGAGFTSNSAQFFFGMYSLAKLPAIYEITLYLAQVQVS